MDVQTCYRHPDRRAGVTCQRCDRPICPSCMSPASVGFHCPECASAGRQRVYTRATLGRLNRPVITQALIAIDVAVFVLGSLGSNGSLFSNVGGRFDDRFSLIAEGFLGRSPVGVAHGEWYRLITGGFLHAGVLHLGMNMFALWILGAQIEPVLGRLRFAVVYGTSLLTASFVVMVIDPNVPTVGASGAIFGLLGLAVANQHARRVNIWQSGLGGVLLINVLISTLPGISWAGHAGGFLGGLVCGLLLYRLGPVLKNEPLITVLCAAVGVAAFVGGLVAAQAAASF